MEDYTKYGYPPAYKQLSNKVLSLIYKRKNYEVLAQLTKMIDIGYGGGLFKNSKTEWEYIRTLWLVRIQLLMEWKMYSEALAWTCLECELNPWNTAAFAMKEQLKQLSCLYGQEISKTKTSQKGRWAKVAGMREIKALLEEEVILPVLHPEVYQNRNVLPLNGVLLYGPPGCGKTFIVENLAEEMDYEFYPFKPSDFGSSYIHGTQLSIAEAFHNLEETASCIAFFDELEAMIPSREQGLYHSYTTEVNEFLVQLNNCAEKGILVIGATNYKKNIDESALRPGRFDKKIFIGPPDLEARAEAFRIKVEPHPHEKINYLSLAEDTEMYSFSDIESIVSTAIRKSIRKNVKITQGLVYEQVLNSKPSLTEVGLRKYFG